ncbi:MAG: 2-C-methyl-D-erythritol 4-phosphate cytidylyltransferase [bacterium]|nr:2-C-methyl-D-erythritol 4-phosphate cytidylyltransferase [bacterium]
MEENVRQVADPVTGPAVLQEPQFTFFGDFDANVNASPASLQGKVSKDPKTAAVILAGGSGTRFGVAGGKQLMKIFGKPVLTWSAEAFDAVADVGLIVIVCPEERMEEYCKVAIDPYPFVTPIELASAADLRQQSSFSGICKVPDSYEIIAIHDGARPLVTPELISHAISAVKGDLDADGVVVGHPALDTLKVVSDGKVLGTPDRNAFWIAQTPQIFRSEIIREAHMMALSEGFVGTDDASLVERIGGSLILVQGPRNNIKLTVPEDFGPIQAALASKIKMSFED